MRMPMLPSVFSLSRRSEFSGGLSRRLFFRNASCRRTPSGASVMLAAALLAGCAGGPSAAPPTVYDFGLPVPVLRASGAGAPAGAIGHELGIAIDVRTPPWFDSPGIAYRLAYDDPLKRREYADSRWTANPGLLLTQRLRQQLGAPDATTACALRIELQEFSQVFDSPQHSRALLQAAATLIDATQRVLAERRFLVEKPVATPDARGGVSALVEAGDDFGRQLAAWLEGMERLEMGPGTKPGTPEARRAGRYPCRAAEPVKARRG